MKQFEARVYELEAEVAKLKLEVASKQAKIDELMLEYCPDEMSKEQLDNWAKHQIPDDPQAIFDMCSSRG